MITIIGKLTQWNVVLQEFTLSTYSCGDLKINIEKCDKLLLDEFLEAMRMGKNIELKVGE